MPRSGPTTRSGEPSPLSPDGVCGLSVGRKAIHVGKGTTGRSTRDEYRRRDVAYPDAQQFCGCRASGGPDAECEDGRDGGGGKRERIEDPGAEAKYG